MNSCEAVPYIRYGSRATTNSRCTIVPRVNHATSSKKIIINGNAFYIPCFLLNYQTEFKELATSIGARQAVLVLAKKYNVHFKSTQQIRRYKYTTSIEPKVYVSTEQYRVVIRLGDFVNRIFSIQVLINNLTYPILPTHVIITDNAQYINICNDDTVTFSTTIDDINAKATRWRSIVVPFKQTNDLTIIERIEQIKNLYEINLYVFVMLQFIDRNGFTSIQTGIIVLVHSKFIFIPIINKKLVYAYKVPQTDYAFKIIYIDAVMQTESEVLSYY